MKISKLSYNPKFTAILIIGICLIGMLLGNCIQRFRYSEYRWIYQYGSFLSMGIVFGSLGWSFLHPLFVWSYRKTEFKKNLIWIFVGLIPILYYSAMMTIAMNKTYE